MVINGIIMADHGSDDGAGVAEAGDERSTAFAIAECLGWAATQITAVAALPWPVAWILETGRPESVFGFAIDAKSAEGRDGTKRESIA